MNVKMLAGVAAVVVVAAAAAGYFYFAAPKKVVLGDIEQYVFIQSTTKAEIGVIDVVNDELVTRLQLAAIPDVLLVAKEPKRVIYSNRATRTIHIYDIATQADEAVITLPFTPDNVVISPDSFMIAATDTQTGQFAAIDIDTKALKFVLEQTFYKPSKLVFSSDSVFVFISDALNGRVNTIDTASGSVLDPIQLSLHMDAVSDPEGDELSALTRTPSGIFGLVTLNADGFVSVINMRQWAENRVLRVGKGASRAYGTADGIYMMVGNDIDRTVTILNTDPWESVATLPGVSGVTSISTGFFEKLAFVVSNPENKVAILNLETLENVGFLDLPGGPGVGIADADGKKLYVPLHDSNSLAVIDIYNKRVHKIIKNVAEAPWGVAMAATNNYCH
ncbi:MAG: hypothetical protein Q8Q63_08685 [Phaeovulum sp.]|uniref:hypothetical protein n=1 Tax=Phaeovulum sp. TaxID=2934796 RepID=UPI0027310960|nr:hypothetical protein [Phaeovulum sp.]MDP2063007.1 hypothetical protein [Phaeovulum sp.]MDP3861646.1 hypothetical protein [Phaeovulum sp.]